MAPKEGEKATPKATKETEKPAKKPTANAGTGSTNSEPGKPAKKAAKKNATDDTTKDNAKGSQTSANNSPAKKKAAEKATEEATAQPAVKAAKPARKKAVVAVVPIAATATAPTTTTTLRPAVTTTIGTVTTTTTAAPKGKKAVVVCVWPALGEDNFFETHTMAKHPSIELQLIDSTDEYRKNGEQDWEAYVAAIQAARDENRGGVILVSSHKPLRALLKSKRIKYHLYHPTLERDATLLPITKNKLPKAYDAIKKNWKIWVESCREEKDKEWCTTHELGGEAFVNDDLLYEHVFAK